MALFPSTMGPDNVVSPYEPGHVGRRFALLPTSSVAPAPEGQSRQRFDAVHLRALADSLKRSGVHQPIVVTPDESTPGHYRIIAGERRWRAAQIAGLQEIPCLVDEGLADPKRRLLAQAEENLHRENLNAVEEAAVLVQLMEAFGIDAQDAGALIGRSYQQARRLIQIHEAPQPIKDAIVQGLVEGRAALELVRIYNRLARHPGPNGKKRAVAQVEELIDRVVYERWTIRRLENHARKLEGGRSVAGTAVQDAASGPQASASSTPGGTTSTAAARAPVGPPWRSVAGGLFLDTVRIARGEFTPEEYAALIKLLEDLLTQTRHSVRPPSRNVSPRG